MNDIEQAAEYIIKAVVSDSKEVEISSRLENELTILEVSAPPEIIGQIIGKEGKKLKGIGKSARLEIEALIGTKVFLEMWVKVRENWRDSDFSLSNFGYKE